MKNLLAAGSATRKARPVVSLGLLLAAGTVATIGTADASPAGAPTTVGTITHQAAVPATPDEGCGYLGGAIYRHCDGGSGSTVMLDVENIWGSITQSCVAPGETNLQPGHRWAIIDAWWNGGVGCRPGNY